MPLEKNPDIVFAQKMMGDGFCIDPKDNKLYAPVDGEVMVFPTKHAIGIKEKDGLEILIHYGIDTVNLNGEGFTAHVNTGEQVKMGQLLLEVDVDRVIDQVPSIITAVLITNLEDKKLEIENYTIMSQGEKIALTLY